MTSTACRDLEAVLGLNFNPDGLTSNADLAPHVDPVGACTYDWVHNMLQDGALSREIEAFFQVAGIDRAAVREFLAMPDWNFPKFHQLKARELHRIFDDKRISAANPQKVKASCAEFLGVYGLVRHFIETEVAADVAAEARQSFFAVCDVLDLLLAAKFRFIDIADVWQRLECATVRFLHLHKLAHGQKHIRPKHHWQLDVPRQLCRDNCVLDAFVIERAHLAVKRVADPVDRTSSFEASVLASLTSTVMQNASEVVPRGLLGPFAPLPGVENAFIADRMEIFSAEISVADVLFRGEAAATVRACCLHVGVRCVFVDVMAILQRPSEHSIIAACTGRLVVWEATDVRLALAWRPCEDGSLLIVRA